MIIAKSAIPPTTAPTMIPVKAFVERQHLYVVVYQGLLKISEEDNAFSTGKQEYIEVIYSSEH